MAPLGDGEASAGAAMIYLRGGPYDGQIERVPVGTAIFSTVAHGVQPRHGTDALHMYSPSDPIELHDGAQVFVYGGITSVYVD